MPMLFYKKEPLHYAKVLFITIIENIRYPY